MDLVLTIQDPGGSSYFQSGDQFKGQVSFDGLDPEVHFAQESSTSYSIGDDIGDESNPRYFDGEGAIIGDETLRDSLGSLFQFDFEVGDLFLKYEDTNFNGDLGVDDGVCFVSYDRSVATT